jgi:hypothetical protein
LDETGDDGDRVDRVFSEVSARGSKRASVDRLQVREGGERERQSAKLRKRKGVRKQRDAPVNPIRHIQRPVSSQRKEVMRRDGLCLARSVEHEELRENPDRFKVDREGPEDFHGGAARVEKTKVSWRA